jgi:hypothetical protein
MSVGRIPKQGEALTVTHEVSVQLHEVDGFFFHHPARVDRTVGSLVALSDGTVEFRPVTS